MNLENKVAIVTGAGRGIGRGIALALASAGASVVVSDVSLVDCVSAAAEIKDKGGRALALPCDVADSEAVSKLMTDTMAEFERIDILVNNAGIYPFKPFLEMNVDDWDKVIDVNLKSIFLCSQAAAKLMPEGGKIVSISSIAAFVGFAGLTHYCASKGGIVGMTRALALELAAKKINVNSVAPGAIETPGASTGMTPEAKKQTEAMIPWGRMGVPDDIAQAVAFLVSPQADYITGQTLIVDGGYTLR
ncbi:MAG: SDR family NAD(P)-dependent oxidoreductase [Patescibacteria group bacterium]|nr:SDR family NAD(P)-dependent oxidoreductase [Patescibacteria group bacterium]